MARIKDIIVFNNRVIHPIYGRMIYIAKYNIDNDKLLESKQKWEYKDEFTWKEYSEAVGVKYER